MKSKFVIAGMFALLILSCSPKVSQPTAQAAPQKTAEQIAHEGAVAEGKGMYENNCAKCHKLYSTTAFTQEEWRPILVRMQRKAHLDDAQMAQITTYINSEAK
jgi:cytochrome c5